MIRLRNLLIATILAASTALPGAVHAHGASVVTGTTGTLLDTGGAFSRSVSRFVGTFRSAVNVQLSGWTLDYRFSDHHIDRASVRIENVVYNPFTGFVSFVVRGAYDDRNDDDDFFWRANFTILSVN